MTVWVVYATVGDSSGDVWIDVHGVYATRKAAKLAAITCEEQHKKLGYSCECNFSEFEVEQ